MSENEVLPDELRHPEIVFIPKVLLTYLEAAQCTGLPWLPWKVWSARESYLW